MREMTKRGKTEPASDQQERTEREVELNKSTLRDLVRDTDAQERM